jgi:hypothetical protein
MISPLDEFGCEFYSGEARLIGQACAQGKWADLHSGVIASLFVGFPPCVHSLDLLLLLPKAVSEVTGRPEVVLADILVKVAGDEGTWGAEILPPEWVHSVAEIPIERIVEVWQNLIIIREREYDYDENWQSPAVVRSLFDLNALCRLSLAKKEDAVHVWTL